MLSCKDITLLLSKETLNKLSIKEKIEMRLHLIMCKACARFSKQMLFVTQVFKGLPDKIKTISKLSVESKDEMKKKISIASDN